MRLETGSIIRSFIYGITTMFLKLKANSAAANLKTLPGTAGRSNRCAQLTSHIDEAVLLNSTTWFSRTNYSSVTN